MFPFYIIIWQKDRSDSQVNWHKCPFQFHTLLILYQCSNFNQSPDLQANKKSSLGGPKSKKIIETKMASHNNWFLVSSLLFTLLQIQTKVFCYQFKVGDLNAWGIPTSANPQVYAKWSKFHNFTLGDSLCKSIYTIYSNFLTFILVLQSVH